MQHFYAILLATVMLYAQDVYGAADGNQLVLSNSVASSSFVVNHDRGIHASLAALSDFENQSIEDCVPHGNFTLQTVYTKDGLATGKYKTLSARDLFKLRHVENSKEAKVSFDWMDSFWFNMNGGRAVLGVLPALVMKVLGSAAELRPALTAYAMVLLGCCSLGYGLYARLQPLSESDLLPSFYAARKRQKLAVANHLSKCTTRDAGHSALLDKSARWCDRDSQYPMYLNKDNKETFYYNAPGFKKSEVCYLLSASYDGTRLGEVTECNDDIATYLRTLINHPCLDDNGNVQMPAVLAYIRRYFPNWGTDKDDVRPEVERIAAQTECSKFIRDYYEAWMNWSCYQTSKLSRRKRNKANGWICGGLASLGLAYFTAKHAGILPTMPVLFSCAWPGYNLYYFYLNFFV